MIPDHLYEEAKRIARDYEMSLAEVFRRGLECMMTSDGLPESERAACLAAGPHPNLIPVLGDVLRHADGDCRLGDFGAAAFYPPGDRRFERLEVLAFGRLLGEILDRCKEAPPVLRSLQARCEAAAVRDRPGFQALESALRS